MTLSEVFTTVSADVRFLTLRDPTGKKFQTMEQVRKHVMKIAKTYFIVREMNKQNTNYHYHAIMKVMEEPGKSWFRKGIHMQLRKIGKSDNNVQVPPPVPGISQQELRESQYDESLLEQYETQVIEKVIKKAGKTCRQGNHVGRVLNYMMKGLTSPVQYVNYQYVVSGKNRVLPPR